MKKRKTKEREIKIKNNESMDKMIIEAIVFALAVDINGGSIPKKVKESYSYIIEDIKVQIQNNNLQYLIKMYNIDEDEFISLLNKAMK